MSPVEALVGLWALLCTPAGAIATGAVCALVWLAVLASVARERVEQRRHNAEMLDLAVAAYWRQRVLKTTKVAS